jgi:nitroreductase
MRKLSFDDKPSQFPTTQVKGGPLKPITQVLTERRATSHFKPDPVPQEYLNAILRLGAQAPSSYNFQPWRFVVIQDAENRKRVKEAAYGQPKVGEAPVILVAFSVPTEWKEAITQVLQEGARRGVGKMENVEETREGALQYLSSQSLPLWMNRHTMIAFTTMMLVAESYGLDTAPMEGFDPEAMKKTLGLPEESVVVAIMAIGFAHHPDKPYGGRLTLSEFVYSESYAEHWGAK